MVLGSLVVHKIIQHEDGTLGVCPTESVAAAMQQTETVELKGLTGDWKEEGMVSCQSQDGYSDALGAVIPEQCCIKAKLTYKGNPTPFDLALQMYEQGGCKEYIYFDRKRITKSSD